MIPGLLRVLPHSSDIEKAVLGALILDPEKIDEAKIKPSVFYKNSNQLIYKALVSLQKKSFAIDLLTLTAQLKEDGNLEKVGGPAYLTDVALSVATSVDVETHIKILTDQSMARKAISESMALIDFLHESPSKAKEAIEEAQNTFSAISRLGTGKIGTGDEVLKKYDSLRITSETEVPEITPVISIGEAVISTPENITVISGESKSSKSALANVMIAGAIYQDEFKAESFKYLVTKKNEERKAVIHFDTEQSRTIHKSRHQGIIKRAGLFGNEPDYYYSYNIRKLDIENYPLITSDICSAAADVCNGIHLIIVDGIADYIKSVNDEETANDIVHFFEQLAVEYQCPIITIIHLNPNSENKQRGHLGSQLQRKAESVLIVKKDKASGISWVEPQFLRNAGNENVPKIQFRYDPEKKYHVFAGERIDEKAGELDKLRYYADSVFKGKGVISRQIAVMELMKLGGFSDRTAKEKLRALEELEFIEKENPKNRKSALLYVNKY